MKYLVIGFSYPKEFKLGAKAISIWMNAPYSHVYLRFKNEDTGISIVYHAAHGMVHFIEYENFKATNNVIKEYPIKISEIHYKETSNECIKLAGIPYGYSELIKIFIRDITYNLGQEIQIKDSPGYICSELVGKLCIDRLGLKFDKPKHLLTPRDIDNALAQIY